MNVAWSVVWLDGAPLFYHLPRGVLGFMMSDMSWILLVGTATSILGILGQFFFNKKLRWLTLVITLTGVLILSWSGYETERDLTAVKDYGAVAKLNYLGTTGTVAPPLEETSPLSISIRSLVSDDGKNATVKCDQSAVNQYKNLIEQYPQYPFGYFYLAACLENQGDSMWRITAKQAIEILGLTTSIAGHNPTQDLALKVLKEELSDQRGLLVRFGSEQNN